MFSLLICIIIFFFFWLLLLKIGYHQDNLHPAGYSLKKLSRTALIYQSRTYVTNAMRYSIFLWHLNDFFAGEWVPDVDGSWGPEALWWPLEGWAGALAGELFSSQWEARHGAATALRDLLKCQGKGAGKERGTSAKQVSTVCISYPEALWEISNKWVILLAELQPKTVITIIFKFLDSGLESPGLTNLIQMHKHSRPTRQTDNIYVKLIMYNSPYMCAV